MAELDQSNVSDENVFVSVLIEKMNGKDKELKIFIDENLFLRKSSLGIEAISKNIEALKAMDNMQQLLVIGMADTFKESNDPSKYLPSLLVLFGFNIAFYGQLYNMIGIPVISFFLSAIVILLLFWIVIRALSIYPTAIYFHSLVTKMKYEN